ncbi:MAG: TlpA disulfide reductase family protein [Phycisphaerales bacterium]
MKQLTCLALSAAALIGVAGLAMAAPPIASPEIVREGSAGDSRRDTLTGMELKAANIDWSLLTDWQNGSAPTADALKDKAVVLIFWSGWQPSNKAQVARVAALAEKYKDKGVVFIAAHNDTRYEGAPAALGDNAKSVLLARDTGNKLRKALLSDADPDLYFIDRAGNLRFADVGSDSLEAAVSTIAAETPAQAAAAPGEFAAMLKDKDAKSRRTVTKGEGIDAGKKTKVAFAPPSPDAYDKAFWPTKNNKDIVEEQATDFQNQAVPFGFDAVQWLNTPDNKAPDLVGKVVIVDFWATWCGPCKRSMPLLDEMQKSFRDDLQIVGVSGFKFGQQSNNSEENEKYPQGEGRPTIVSFLREHNTEYAHAYDTGSAIMKKLAVKGIPMVYVLSTDGIVRWEGNPLMPNFRKTVEQIINADPGVKARRTAEATAIKAKDDAAKSKAGVN